jgi:hypothetical protein
MLTIKERPRDLEKEYQDILQKIKNGDTATIEIDELLYVRIRIGILDEEVSNTDIQVVHEDSISAFTEESQLDPYPKECFSNNFHLSQQWLRAWIRYKKRRTEMRITPWIKYVEELGPTGIFVFGSNEGGRHSKGAALLAKSFGAVDKQGAGLMGRTYGIPTKPVDVRSRLTIPKIEKYVDEFIEFARNNTQYVFYVTEIGCGLAGYSPAEIAPLFSAAKELENVFLPKKFRNVLDEK